MFKLALRTFATTLILGTVAATFSTARAQAPAAAPSTTTAGNSEVGPGERKYTLIAEQVGDTKFWFPSTIVAQPGDKITLVLKNEIPGTATTHGFELPAFNVSEIVTRGEKPKLVHFTADRPGIFPYYCQLHPGHVGGDLLVIPNGK